VVGGLPNILVNKVLYSTLVKYDASTLAAVGDLAESWQASPDGLAWTFKLRRNVKWHDGRPFTARDVKFTFDVWLNPQVPYYLRGNLAGVKGTEIVDDFTVRVAMEKPAASLPVLLGYLMNIIPEHLLRNVSPRDMISPVAFLRNPIGTGMFKFKEFVPGSHVHLVANDDYYGGRPNLDGIVFKIIPDIEVHVAQLQTGQLDLALLEPYQVKGLEKVSNIEIRGARQVNHYLIALNNEREFFKDRRVRQALVYAQDREAMLKNIGLGYGRLATGPINPLMGGGFPADLKPFSYDPDKARQLLREAGWRPGRDGVLEKDGTRFSVSMIMDRGNPTRSQFGVAAKSYWGRVGVDVRLETLDFNAWLGRQRANPPTYETAVAWLITPPDPDVSAYYQCGAGLANAWRFCNRELDEALNKARATLDVRARARIYHRVQEIIYTEAANVFIFYPDEIQALHRRVKGFPKIGYRDAMPWAHRIWIAD
ncbi:MAG: hypothetical protein HY660_11705, partial [Armatimonadetes bacterium]|nr:hypothetical protein [Armatimonadota bacterium]